MPVTHKNRLVTTISNTPSTTGALTISTASSGYQTFAAGDDGLTFDVVIVDGTAWEVRTGCTYTHSGTSLSRGTLEDSSTGSAIDFTSAAVVSAVANAARGMNWDAAAAGYISGGEIAYSSTTVITVAACKCRINGKLLSTSSTTTLTSASTMKDLAGSTVTLGASKSYYVYAFDNSGTLEFRVQDYAAATYGGAPTWDSDYAYWKGPSVGVQARRIGKFFTNGSSQIIQFSYVGGGTERKRKFHSASSVTLLSGGTGGGAGALASVTITPYIGADDTQYDVGIGLALSSGSTYAQGVISVFGSASSIYQANRKIYWSSTYGTNILGTDMIPNTGTMHYWAVTASTSMTIWLNAVEHLV